MSETAAAPTREANLDAFRAAAQARETAPVATPPAPETVTPVAAPTESATPAAPSTSSPAEGAGNPQGAVPPSAATPDTVTFERAKLKRQLKWLDEVEDIDLAHLLETAPEKIDEAFRKAKDRDRQEAKRRDAEEALPVEVKKAVTARDKQWSDLHAASGLRFDPTSRKLVPLQASAPTNTAGQPGLAALKAKAKETGNFDDAMAYIEALEEGMSKPMDKAAIASIVAEFVTQRETDRQATETLSRALTSIREASKASLDAMGDRGVEIWDYAIEMGKKHSRLEGATHESTMKVVRDTVVRWTTGAAAPRPAPATPAPVRPKAPTPIPSGGAPASTVADPSKLSRDERVAALRRQGEARRGVAV